MAIEIERKFLMKKPPKNLELVESFIIYRGYICTEDTEIRITEFRDSQNNIINLSKYPKFETAHKLTIKQGNGLYRNEFEFFISEKDYLEIAKRTLSPLIRKDYFKYKLENNLYLEFSIVDKGTSTEFSYGEIEFSSEEEALNYKIDWEDITDVTGNKFYSMKNYWNRTRLENTKCICYI